MWTIKRNQVWYNFDPDNAVVCKCKVGDEILFETQDCFSGQIKSENDKIEHINMSNVNPCTGPLYIEDAISGSVLEISVQKIQPIEPGILLLNPAGGVLKEYITSPFTKIVQFKDDKIIFADGIEIPSNPFVGTIGTTLPGRIPTGLTGNHGGNMDCPYVRPGSKIYFPVFVKGALLMLGDAHASMGEGEICIGTECSADVVIKINNIHKDVFIESPIIETEKSWIVNADAPDLKQAILSASKRIVDWVVRKTDVTTEEATLLMSIGGNVRLSQAAEAGYNYTVHAIFPKKIFVNGELNSFFPLRY